MIEQKTLVDQIEITRFGTIQIRFALLILENGAELASAWHRTSLSPGDDLDVQIAAVNTHLVAMGRNICQPKELPRLRAIVEAVHTPEVVADYRRRVAENSLSSAPRIV